MRTVTLTFATIFLTTVIYLFVESVRRWFDFYGNVLASRFHGGDYVKV
jgi:hypothetical protein